MPDLPPELFPVIISFISDPPTLCALCLSHRTLRYAAEKQLYSSVENKSSSARTFKFLSTIVKTPRLAEYVIQYRFLGQLNIPVNPDMLRLVAEGFITMKNLKFLRFSESYVTPFHAELLDKDCGVSFQLEMLSFDEISEGNYLQKVLEQQRHTLRELYLESIPRATFSPAPLTFPRLTRLSGDLQVLESFIVGSRVTYLTWVVTEDEDDSIPDEGLRARLEGMAKELGAVRAFCLEGRFHRPGLSIFRGLLDNMEIFRLSLSRSSPTEEIELFPSLRKLVLSPGTPLGLSPIRLKDRPGFVAQLFENCPKLIVMYFQQDWNRKTRFLIYQKWERGSPVPIDMISTDVVAELFL